MLLDWAPIKILELLDSLLKRGYYYDDLHTGYLCRPIEPYYSKRNTDKYDSPGGLFWIRSCHWLGKFNPTRPEDRVVYDDDGDGDLIVTRKLLWYFTATLGRMTEFRNQIRDGLPGMDDNERYALRCLCHDKDREDYPQFSEIFDLQARIEREMSNLSRRLKRMCSTMQANSAEYLNWILTGDIPGIDTYNPTPTEFERLRTFWSLSAPTGTYESWSVTETEEFRGIVRTFVARQIWLMRGWV